MHERVPQSPKKHLEKAIEAAKKTKQALEIPIVYFRGDNFMPLDPPLTREQMLKREDWMMDVANVRTNEDGDVWTVPSEGDHYRYDWKWDALKGAVINARRGKPDRARQDFLTLERFRDPETGFLSNKIFATAKGKTWRDYPEAWTFNRPEIGSSYSQPSLNAWAAMETYNSFVREGREQKGQQFLEEIYGHAEPGNYTELQGEYAYFKNHRQNSPEDPLIYIVHPNETGRDFDEALGPDSPFIEQNKTGKKGGTLIDLRNASKRWLDMQKFGRQIGKLGRDTEGKRIDWIPEKIREKYGPNDVMMNVLYADGLRHMAEISQLLGKENEQKQYAEHADAVEKAILERMWNEDDGFFYNIDKDGKRIPVRSITGLFPLMLKNISPEQVASLNDKLEDPEWFNTNYPIPTHPVNSKFYDPHYRRYPNPPWSGPVWINSNFLITDTGLARQAERFLFNETGNAELGERCLKNAGRIAQQTEKLLAINPDAMECYDPDTGQGRRVKVFMWSNLGLHFDGYNDVKRRLEEQKGA